MTNEDSLRHGKITIMRHSDIEQCPFRIMTPEHYRADGTCRCNEREHGIMEEWGYVWNADKHTWISPDEDDDEV